MRARNVIQSADGGGRLVIYLHIYTTCVPTGYRYSGGARGRYARTAGRVVRPYFPRTYRVTAARLSTENQCDHGGTRPATATAFPWTPPPGLASLAITQPSACVRMQRLRHRRLSPPSSPSPAIATRSHAAERRIGPRAPLAANDQWRRPAV